MSAIQLTSAQLAERAVAGLGGTPGASWSRRVDSGEACPHQACYRAHCRRELANGADSVESDSDDDEDNDDDDSSSYVSDECIDEQFIDPTSPRGVATAVMGRAEDVSPVALYRLHCFDRDTLLQANRYAEHCWNRTYTLEALRDSELLTASQTLLSEEEWDLYLEHHGKRDEDELPYAAHNTTIRTRPDESVQRSGNGTPTPRPGPPLLGRATSSYAGVSTDRRQPPGPPSTAYTPQVREAGQASSARTPTPRRRVSNQADGPASMTEEARQELYELYQYASDGSGQRARHSDSDALSSGLRQIDLDPLGYSNGGATLDEVEVEEELYEEEVGEEIIDRPSIELHDPRRCDDLEAEAAERERDSQDARRRRDQGSTIGR